VKKISLIAALLWAFSSAQGMEGMTLRFGHFPNVTHTQALVAHSLSRQGKGWFEQRLEPEVTLQWFVYNAGPSAMEALFAGSLDVSYVGPSPALNAYARSGGEEVRAIAGATIGGSALIVQPDGRIKQPEDFRGKKVATPQLGNTQDVSCRSWLTAHGFRITQLGGDVQVVPTANPDQLSLFQRGTIDAVWTVEPWVSRLELEAGGKSFVEEKDAITTILVSRAKFLKEHRQLAKKLAQAHAELTAWIDAHPTEAQKLVRDELVAEMKHDISADLISHAWRRLRFTSEISLEPFDQFMVAAQQAGFLREKIDLKHFVEVP